MTHKTLIESGIDPYTHRYPKQDCFERLCATMGIPAWDAGIDAFASPYTDDEMLSRLVRHLAIEHPIECDCVWHERDEDGWDEQWGYQVGQPVDQLCLACLVRCLWMSIGCDQQKARV